MTYSLHTLTDTPAAPPAPRAGVARYAQELALVLGGVALAFWLLALASYSTLDPAFSTSGAGLPVHNWGGKLGAWIADGSYFLLGFSAKADQLAEPARVAIPGGGIVVTDQVAVTTELADPTASFEGEQEAAVRMITGRLRPEVTPDGVAVTGNVTLDDLRKVFPGY